jgi:hypothetical protein
LRKLRIITLTALGIFALSAVAFAAQVNTYTVSAALSPTKAGTKKKPVAVKLDFNYTVGEQSGQRPALINKYDINFGGGQVNTNIIPGCSAASIKAAQSDASCPKGSLVGTGNVENLAGPSSDPSPGSQLKCHLDLKIYNSRNNHAALYLHGAPPTCPIAVDDAIDAQYVKKNGGTSLIFTVPDTLLHPSISTFDNSVVQVKSTINKITGKLKGKKRGYFESAGGCVKGKRKIQVVFTQPDGTSATVKNTAKCTA